MVEDTNSQPGDKPGEEAEPAGNDHPGRPHPPDEIDPELLSLRKPRTKLGPVMSATIVVFCGYLMFQLRGDLEFSRKSEAPSVVISIDTLESHDLEDFVAIDAVPDRASSARIFHSKAKDGIRISPVFGSRGSLWLVVHGNTWSTNIGYTEHYEGRLTKMSTMPFFDDVREYYASTSPAPRFVTIEALRTALDSGKLVDPSGDAIALSPTLTVRVETVAPDIAEVSAFSTDDYPDEAAWRAVLSRHGIIDSRTGPLRGSEQAWIYQVKIPAGTDDIARLLVEAKLFAARVDPILRSYEAKWADVASANGGLDIGDNTVTWAEISDVSVDVRRRVDENALVLLTDERPENYWYILPLFIMLGVIAALFLWALVVSLRGDEPPTVVEAADSPA